MWRVAATTAKKVLSPAAAMSVALRARLARYAGVSGWRGLVARAAVSGAMGSIPARGRASLFTDGRRRESIGCEEILTSTGRAKERSPSGVEIAPDAGALGVERPRYVRRSSHRAARRRPRTALSARHAGCSHGPP